MGPPAEGAQCHEQLLRQAKDLEECCSELSLSVMLAVLLKEILDQFLVS